MKTDITLATLAERWRRFDFTRPEPESHCVMHKNNNSVGNRHISWRNIAAYRNYDGDAEVMNLDAVYKSVDRSECSWHHLFQGVHYGLIVGPETLCAVEECLEILRNDEPPEDDGKKVKHVNWLGGVNYISKPTHHDWELTTKLGRILSSAFFSDRANRLLYSDAYTYVYTSHSGWNRSC